MLDLPSWGKLSYKADNIEEPQLPKVANEILERIFSNSDDATNIIWLMAEMGTGKSTLVRNMFWELGLSRKYPVQSPTFSLMNEYEISGKMYAHLDLYRVKGEFSFEELSLFDLKQFRGIFIEWPQMVDNSDTDVSPTHIVQLGTISDTARSYELYSKN